MSDNTSAYVNPFDDNEHQFLIIKNELMQLSLWPEFKQVPAGWLPIFGPESRDSALEFVQAHATGS